MTRFSGRRAFVLIHLKEIAGGSSRTLPLQGAGLAVLKENHATRRLARATAFTAPRELRCSRMPLPPTSERSDSPKRWSC